MLRVYHFSFLWKQLSFMFPKTCSALLDPDIVFFPPGLELCAVAPFCSRGSLQTLMVLPETSAQLSIKARNELGNALGLFVNESIFKHR